MMSANKDATLREIDRDFASSYLSKFSPCFRTL